MRILKCAKPKKDADDTSRERLLHAAAKLFAVNGYDRVSIRDIAKESKCNLSMVSYYFGGKEKLYQQLFEAFFQRVDSHIESTEARTGAKDSFTKKQFLEEVRASLRFMLDEYRSDPFLKIVIHREGMDGFPHTKALFDKHMSKIKDRIAGLYVKAQKAGYIRASIHAPTFAVLLNRGLEAYLVAYLFAKPIRDIGMDPLQDSELFLDQIEEIFFKGVLT